MRSKKCPDNSRSCLKKTNLENLEFVKQLSNRENLTFQGSKNCVPCGNQVGNVECRLIRKPQSSVSMLTQNLQRNGRQLIPMSNSVGLNNCVLSNFGAIHLMSAGPGCIEAPTVCTNIDYNPKEVCFATEKPPFIIDVECTESGCCPMPKCPGWDPNVNLGYPFSTIPQPLPCKAARLKP